MLFVCCLFSIVLSFIVKKICDCWEKIRSTWINRNTDTYIFIIRKPFPGVFVAKWMANRRAGGGSKFWKRLSKERDSVFHLIPPSKRDWYCSYDTSSCWADHRHWSWCGTVAEDASERSNTLVCHQHFVTGGPTLDPACYVRTPAFGNMMVSLLLLVQILTRGHLSVSAFVARPVLKQSCFQVAQIQNDGGALGHSFLLGGQNVESRSLRFQLSKSNYNNNNNNNNNKNEKRIFIPMIALGSSFWALV